MDFIGRVDELKVFKNLINTTKSELCAVIGRRRVGKTYFINHATKDHLFFRFTGKYDCPVSIQLDRFSAEFQEHFNRAQKPSIATWFDAFDLLKYELKSSRIRKKKIVFLDEFPWMDTKNSNFITAFSDFWAWAVLRKDILVVICGSAASWMIKNIFKNRGSLYNRVTCRIELNPFNLNECSRFLKAKGIIWKNDSIIKLYMVMGGIPFYLDQLTTGEGLDQAIDRLFFHKKAVLRLEFDELFASLFGNPTPYEKIVKVLSSHTDGCDRTKLLKATKYSSGGNFSKMITDLEASGFITTYVPLGKNEREAIYKLTDPYTLFYLKYVQGNSMRSKQPWNYLAKTPSWYSWSGLAFENLCFLHINEIKKQLKIEGVFSRESLWRHKGNNEMYGAQIDLVIDRDDNIINICEIKYSAGPFVITSDYSKTLQKKLASFQFFTKTRKTLFLTFITVNGLHENMYSIDFVQNNIEMNNAFDL